MFPDQVHLIGAAASGRARRRGTSATGRHPIRGSSAARFHPAAWEGQQAAAQQPKFPSTQQRFREFQEYVPLCEVEEGLQIDDDRVFFHWAITFSQ